MTFRKMRFIKFNHNETFGCDFIIAYFKKNGGSLGSRMHHFAMKCIKKLVYLYQINKISIQSFTLLRLYIFFLVKHSMNRKDVNSNLTNSEFIHYLISYDSALHENPREICTLITKAEEVVHID